MKGLKAVFPEVMFDAALFSIVPSTPSLLSFPSLLPFSLLLSSPSLSLFTSVIIAYCICRGFLEKIAQPKGSFRLLCEIQRLRSSSSRQLVYIHILFFVHIEGKTTLFPRHFALLFTFLQSMTAVLQYYGNNVKRALSHVYPNIGLDHSKFIASMPRNFSGLFYILLIRLFRVQLDGY